MKLYHLSTCNTCQRIIKELELPETAELQDIKTDPITSDQLEEMHDLSGSYESLFSRKARKFRGEGWHEKELGEEDYKNLILKEYTFLKRPVLIDGSAIFIGNSKKVVEGAKNYVSGK